MSSNENITNSSRTSQIWDALMTIFKSEMNVGPTGPGSGSNSSGRLQTVATIARSIAVAPPFPAIGVQKKKYTQKFYGSSRIAFTAQYLIIAAVQAQVNAAGLVLLDDANEQLETITDDGNGNGIGPILLDPANWGLGGLCLTMLIDEWEDAWQDPAATDSAPLALSVATFTVTGQIERRNPSSS